jgi:hypothetical protein
MSRLTKAGRPGIHAGLLFLFIVSGCAEKPGFVNDIIFPLFGRIYEYDIASDSLAVKRSTGYILSKSFSRYGAMTLMSGTPTDTRNLKRVIAFDSKTNRITDILTGNFMKVILLPGYVVTVSPEFVEGKGFLHEFFRVHTGPPATEKIHASYIDIITDDAELIGDAIFFAGYDSREESNTIIRVDLDTRTERSLFQCERHRDFLKLVSSGESVIVYLSVQDWYAGGRMDVWTVNATSVRKDVEASVRAVAIPDGGYVPYGKGFYDDGRVFVPVIDRDHTCGMIGLELTDLSRCSAVTPLPTCLYATLPAPGGGSPPFLYFIGYNYYREKNRFYFLRLPREVEHGSSEGIVCMPIE